MLIEPGLRPQEQIHLDRRLARIAAGETAKLAELPRIRELLARKGPPSLQRRAAGEVWLPLQHHLAQEEMFVSLQGTGHRMIQRRAEALDYWDGEP